MANALGLPTSGKSRKRKPVNPKLYMANNEWSHDLPKSLADLEPGEQVEVTALITVLEKTADKRGAKEMWAEIGRIKPAKGK